MLRQMRPNLLEGIYVLVNHLAGLTIKERQKDVPVLDVIVAGHGRRDHGGCCHHWGPE